MEVLNRKKFEHHTEPLLPKRQFLIRLARHAFSAFGITCVALGIGVLGYHGFEGLTWVDSLVNASMILAGMGPVNTLQTTGGKLFASFYALFSGLVFLIIVGVLIVPVFHRFLHRFHLESEKEKE